MACNVLIVDDSSSMRAIIRKIIKVSGFNIGELLEAADGKEAIKVLTDEWVDLVLTDINMPNMSGLELISEMKKDEMLKLIPVVMVTTEGSEKRIQESMKLGASGYIKKPFLPEEIKRTLSAIMGEDEDGQRDHDEDDEGIDF
ncbi:MAG: response regulator [Deltaproteobacteria bacterium]|nr:response regulator [Deltaproteobacteria bacterium]